MHEFQSPNSLGCSPELNLMPSSSQIRQSQSATSSGRSFKPVTNDPGVEEVQVVSPSLLQLGSNNQASYTSYHALDILALTFDQHHAGRHSHTFVYSVHSTPWKSLCSKEEDTFDAINDLYIFPNNQHSLPSLETGVVSAGASQPLILTPTYCSNHTYDLRQHPDQSHTRSLTSSFDVGFDNMILSTALPGTPPELTDSRSSKTSSYGSQFSSPEGLSSDNVNFEDIGLDEEDLSTRTGHSQPNTPSRSDDKENTPNFRLQDKRPTLSSIQTRSTKYLRSVENGSKSAVIGSANRGFTSPAIPAYSGAWDRLSRTRSESPQQRLAISISNTSLSRIPSSSGRATSQRRGSWQPNRKSIREIEAEYHDSDDELPDDASLFNVPISPFPSAMHSAQSSARGSPERDPMAKSPRPVPLEHVRTAPETPPQWKSSAQPITRHLMTPRLSSSSLAKSSPTSPKLGSIRNGRTKSWNTAMADLSLEARVVSENLEYLSGTFQSANGNLPLVSHRCSAPGAIQLPPVQRGALDFMPVSKEKEAILSRTRPSWLPPKDPREEKRHLRQYEAMMRASMEAEKKREDRAKRQQVEKDDTSRALNRIWDFYVNPSTDIENIDPRVHDLCWRGVTPKQRGKVWQRAIGNRLGLNSSSYGKALRRAQDIKALRSEVLGDHEKRMVTWFSDIRRDAETAFPELNMFQHHSPLWQDLINVCEAYTSYRSDIGYTYGLQLVGALLLLQLSDAAEVFVLLANCLNQPLPLAFQIRDIAAVNRTYQKVQSTLAIKFPRLHDYLFGTYNVGGLGFTGEELFEPMFRTMFANGLDIDRLCRVWDVWVFEGDRYLIRTAVALLGSLQTQIYDIDGDLHLKKRNVQEMLAWGPFNRCSSGTYWDLKHNGSEDAFVEEIRMAGKLDYTGR